MLIATTASNGPLTRQSFICTSTSRGGATLTRPSCEIQSAMLARASGLISLGCQYSSGIARAKNTACSPEPEAISSTLALGASMRCSTASIGSRLRAVDGEKRRPSVASTPRLRGIPDRSECSPCRKSARRLPSWFPRALRHSPFRNRKRRLYRRGRPSRCSRTG